VKQNMVNLSCIARVIAGQSPPSTTYNEEGEGLPFYQGKTDFGADFPTPRKWCSKPKKTAEPGDILISVRAPVGPTNLANEQCCIGRGLGAIRCDLALTDTAYILHYLKYFEPRLAAQGNGSTFSAIKREDLEKVEIPLPPLPEQKRIAAILDKADAIRRKRKEAIDLSDEFLRSVFLDMFGNFEKPSSPKIKLSEMEGLSLQNGLSPSSRGLVSAEVLTLSAITKGRFDGSQRKSGIFASVPEGKTLSQELFLICRGNGNKNLVGIGVFPTENDNGCLYPDTMISMEFKNTPWSRHFFEFIWNSPLVRRQIIKAAKTTNGTFKINQSAVANITIPIPDESLQNRFSEINKCVEAMRKKQVAQNKESELLFNSIQQRAFRGDL